MFMIDFSIKTVLIHFFNLNFFPLRIQTVQITKILWPWRSEPSSRTFLIGEQPNAWDLLQPRAKVSRHRGAELRRRYGRLGGTSLLSLE